MSQRGCLGGGKERLKRYYTLYLYYIIYIKEIGTATLSIPTRSSIFHSLMRPYNRTQQR